MIAKTIIFLKRNKLIRIILFPIIIIRKTMIAIRRNLYLFFFRQIFSRIEKGTVAVRVPWFGGRFLMDVKSRTLIRITAFDEYEEDLAGLTRERLRNGGDAIDVGANIGFYTVLMAKSSRPKHQVLAIEPLPANIRYLKANLKENNITDKVIIFEGVAGKTKRDSVVINSVKDIEEQSRIGTKLHPEITTKSKKALLAVKQETLDNLIRKYRLRPSLIKIDTEGAEYFVLLGAKEAIKRFRPTIICEFDREAQADYKITGDQILNFFKSIGYNVFFAEKETILAEPK
jgi:FkbM family methyltransferase